jgi:hypothetical protein
MIQGNFKAIFRSDPGYVIMSDWPSNLFSAVEDFATGMEDLITEVSIGAVATLERMVELSVEVSEEIALEVTDAFTDAMKDITADWSVQVQEFLDTDLEAFLNTLLHPLTIDSLEDWVNAHYSTNDNFYPGSVPIVPHPLCANCKHFHGQAYNDIAIVCGMHPYGIAEGQNACEDQELRIEN